MTGSRETSVKPRPIFIIGAPRSGTSITTWVLGQHPNIQAMPETGWIASMGVAAFLSHRKGSERGRLSHLSNVAYPVSRLMARVGSAVDEIVHDVYRERCRALYGEEVFDPDWTIPAELSSKPMHIRRRGSDPKQRWIDGTPLNTFYAWALARMFPEAKFVHNLRRPDEVATSLEGFDKVGATPQSLETGLETWIQHTDQAWYVERGLGKDRVFRLHFERISTEPEALFREVCNFLEEPFHEDCMLPLAERLNSSQVDDRRSANLEALRMNPIFQRAEAVYRMVDDSVPGQAEDDAQEVVESRFHDYCHGRSIV